MRRRREVGVRVSRSRRRTRRISGMFADVKCTVELGADLKSDTNYSLAASQAQVPPETVAYLLFTSGTSGTPKGIEVEHRAYLTAALARLDTLERKPRSRVLQVTPPPLTSPLTICGQRD